MRPLVCILVAAILALALVSVAPPHVDAPVAATAAAEATTSTEPGPGRDSERLPDGIEGENGATIVGGNLFDYTWEDGTPLEPIARWFLLGMLAAAAGGPDTMLTLFPVSGSHPEIVVIR